MATICKSFLCELCAQSETPSKSWQGLPVEFFVRCIDDLLSDVEVFDAACNTLFDTHRGAGMKSVSTEAMQSLAHRLAERLECRDSDTMVQLADALCNLDANRVDESGFDRDEFKAFLVRMLALLQDSLRARVPAAGEKSVQPVRLRMKSADKLCVRTMEVEWENGSGQRQSWSSWDDQVHNGWYEAEKVLPSSAVDISVHFKVRGVTTSIVKKVDRKNGCKWTREKGTKKQQKEIFWLRASAERTSDPVDITFKLRGPYGGCFVQKAWNAARIFDPEDWEHWDGNNCPRPVPSLATLQAADRVSPPNAGTDDPLKLLESRQLRLNAAASKLVDIRRETINGLRKLDSSITKQWLGVNSANTATAGLALGSAVTMFVVPPVGIGLGIAAAASGGMTTAADVTEDSCMMKAFRNQLSLDNLNTIAVAELESEWLLAHERAVEAYAERGVLGNGSAPADLGKNSARVLQVGSTITNIVADLADGGVAAARGTAAASAAARGTAATAGRVLGVFGAVVATGVAVHGWSTTKFSQKAVRAKAAEMTSSLLYMQRWLAGLEHLECAICLECLPLLGETRRCSDNFHYFHAQCLQEWCQTCVRQDWEITCPECRGHISEGTHTLHDFVFSDVDMLKEPTL
jgi:hypothetical protein